MMLRAYPRVDEPVSNVLKWLLLVAAVATFGVLAWAIVVTYVLAAAAALMAWDFIVKARRLVSS
jgi:hypothetical protein